MSSITNFSNGPTLAPQGGISTETIIMGAVLVAVVILVVYVAKSNFEKNKVSEECSHRLLKDKCKKSVGNAIADTILDAAPLVACIPPLHMTPGCLLAAAKVYKSVNKE